MSGFKKNAFYLALCALFVPFSLYAIGLGKMTLKSALDQPFAAEIELIDIKNYLLSGLTVKAADPQYFRRVGIDVSSVLSSLKFQIVKNEKGIMVVQVRSMERITEPHIELIIDLTWSEGQLYKAYTVFLDPPEYQLISDQSQNKSAYYAKIKEINKSKVIKKVSATSIESGKKNIYGPTVNNDNVWQIAYRFKTIQTILPQVVLAIVGANPESFTNGNLNGLKEGKRLKIPSTEEILRVHSELATEEVMAHDSAWNNKTAINHVLIPPYIKIQRSNDASDP